MEEYILTSSIILLVLGLIWKADDIINTLAKIIVFLVGLYGLILFVKHFWI